MLIDFLKKFFKLSPTKAAYYIVAVILLYLIGYVFPDLTNTVLLKIYAVSIGSVFVLLLISLLYSLAGWLLLPDKKETRFRFYLKTFLHSLCLSAGVFLIWETVLMIYLQVVGQAGDLSLYNLRIDILILGLFLAYYFNLVVKTYQQNKEIKHQQQLFYVFSALMIGCLPILLADFAVWLALLLFLIAIWFFNFTVKDNVNVSLLKIVSKTFILTFSLALFFDSLSVIIFENFAAATVQLEIYLLLICALSGVVTLGFVFHWLKIFFKQYFKSKKKIACCEYLDILLRLNLPKNIFYVFYYVLMIFVIIILLLFFSTVINLVVITYLYMIFYLFLISVLYSLGRYFFKAEPQNGMIRFLAKIILNVILIPIGLAVLVDGLRVYLYSLWSRFESYDLPGWGYDFIFVGAALIYSYFILKYYHGQKYFKKDDKVKVFVYLAVILALIVVIRSFLID